MTETETRRWIRPDGVAKATGQAHYTADLAFPGLAHAKLLLAGRAHARIVRLDTTRARALPGVLAILTDADVPDRRYGSFDYVLDRTLFARDVVRFEGEVVAAVAALSVDQAAAAVAAIEVEYEDLPAVLDVEAALEPGSPLVHEGIAGYAHDPNLAPTGNVAGRNTIVKHDPDAAMAAAPIRIRERYVADMAHPVPIEPHTVAAEWLGDRVTVWSSTQVPFYARAKTAEVLEIPSIASASSSATWAAASAASATSTSRRTSPRSPRPRGGRSGWCSAGRRSSSPRTR